MAKVTVLLSRKGPVTDSDKSRLHTAFLKESERKDLLWTLFFLFPVLSSERCSQRFGTPVSASKVVPEGRAAGHLLRQKMPLKQPDPPSNVNQTFSDHLESRYLFNVYYEFSGIGVGYHFIRLSW